MDIHIITDSLGGPRISRDQDVFYEDTWISKLINNHEDINFSYLIRHSLNSSEILNNISKYLIPFKSDYNIIQVGIVDSFPRVLLKKERFLIMNLPFSIGNKIILKFIKKYYNNITNLFYRNEVDIKSFKYNICFLSNNYNCQFIPIIPPSSEYLKTCSKAGIEIQKYNNILCENSINPVLFRNFLKSIDNINGEYVIEDHHHLNIYGHKKIMRYVESFINAI